MSLAQSLRGVPVKNRIIDAEVSIIFNSETWVWKPGETVYLPRDIADWMRNHSLYMLDNNTYQHKYKLCIVGEHQDESDLIFADLPLKTDSIIDWKTRQYVGPNGQTFKRVIVPVNGVAVPPVIDKSDVQREALRVDHAALVDAGVEKLASYSESEVAAGLAELARIPMPPAN